MGSPRSPMAAFWSGIVCPLRYKFAGLCAKLRSGDTLPEFVAITKPAATTTSIRKLRASTTRFITLPWVNVWWYVSVAQPGLLPNLEIAEKRKVAKLPDRRHVSATRAENWRTHYCGQCLRLSIGGVDVLLSGDWVAKLLPHVHRARPVPKTPQN